MRERSFLYTHKIHIRAVHADICKIIRETNGHLFPPVTSPAAPAVANPAVASRPPKPEVDTHHNTYQIGDTVLVKSALKAYAEFTSLPDVIKRVVQGLTYFFCVFLDCPLQFQAVQRINSLHFNKVRFPFLKQDESDLLCLKVGQIEARKNHHTAAGSDATLLGKRKTDSGGT